MPLNFGSQLEEADQKQGDECCPNLDLESVSRATGKGFDAEILFDAFEKEFHLPASLINGGDGFGTQVQMVGSVNELASALVIPPDHAAKEAPIVFGGVLGHNNDFVLSNVAPGGKGPGLHYNPGCVVFQAGHEIDLLSGQRQKPIVAVVAAVKDEHRSFRKLHGPRHLHIGCLAFGDRAADGA